MADCNESKRLLKTECKEQFHEELQAELAKFEVLQLAMQTLKKLTFCEEGTENMHRAIKMLHINEYLHFNGKEEQTLLNLTPLDSVNLSYSERKNIAEQLLARMDNEMQPKLQLARKLQKDCPELYEQPDGEDLLLLNLNSNNIRKEGVGLSNLHIKKLATEQRYANKLTHLLKLKHKKCELLKQLADRKQGPQLVEELELLELQMESSKSKADLLDGYFNKEFLTRNDHTLTAIQKIQAALKQQVKTEDDGKIV